MSSIPAEDCSSQEPAAQGPGTGQPGRGTGREAVMAGDPPSHAQEVLGLLFLIPKPLLSLSQLLFFCLSSSGSFYITDTGFL